MHRVVVLLLIGLGMAGSALGQTCPCDSCDATLKANCGEWSAIATSNWPIRTEPFAKPLVPVHMILTKTGKVLMWKNSEATGAGAHYWDPVTFANIIIPVTTPVDSSLFCAGHLTLTDGRVVTIGGQCSNLSNCSDPSQAPFGIVRTMVFDPDAPGSGFAQRRDMAHPRWYPTATMLPDGKVLSISGWKKGNNPGVAPDSAEIADVPEVWAPFSGTWSSFSNAPKKVISLYPFMQVDPSPNGTRVLYLGPGAHPHDEHASSGPLQPAQRLKDIETAAPSWENSVGTYSVRGGAFARFDRNKVLKSGGTPAGGGVASAQTEVLTIDMSTGNVTAALTDDMCAARAEHQLVILADGQVLAIAGSTVEGGGGDFCSNGVFETELWDGTCWRRLAEMRPRSPKGAAHVPFDGGPAPGCERAVGGRGMQDQMPWEHSFYTGGHFLPLRRHLQAAVPLPVEQHVAPAQ